MQPDEKNKLFKTLDDLKRDISDLKSELNKINEVKEEWFSKRNDLSKKRKDINKISDIKKERDSFTSQVKENKAKRAEFNTKIKDKVGEIKKLEDMIVNQKKKNSGGSDPRALKREIKKLEYRVETDVMSFENEKKIMKQIKEMKKKMAGSDAILSLLDKKRVIQREIDELRSQAKVYHDKVRSNADDSQKKHEELLGMAKEVKTLGKEGSEAHNMSMEMKQKFNELNAKLHAKLQEYNKISGQVGEVKKSNFQAKQMKKEEFLKQKEKEVEEKMKSGKKLTQDDLMYFQGSE